MRGFFGSQWEVGSLPQAMIIPCAADLVISPERRDRGIYTQLMRYALADLARLHEVPYFQPQLRPRGALGRALNGVARDRAAGTSRNWERPQAGDRDPLAELDALLAAGDTELSPGVLLSAEPRPGEMAEVVLTTHLRWSTAPRS